MKRGLFNEVISAAQEGRTGCFVPGRGYPGRHADKPGWPDMGVEPR